MTTIIELRRHTASDGDVLTSSGVAAAVELGRTLGPFDLVVSSGAQRATQTAACILAGMSRVVGGGVVVDEGFRSEQEERWREIYASSRRGDLETFLMADYPFVEAEGQRFAEALRRVAGHVPRGRRALVIGHSPMLEAAVWAVTGRAIRALASGDGVVLEFADGSFTLRE